MTSVKPQKVFQLDLRFTRLSNHIRRMTGISTPRFAVNAWAKREKVKFLGSGGYAEVYMCPWDKTKCIKFGWDTNDGWLKYAALCIKYAHLKNPMIPKIHNLMVFDKFYVALLERYTDIIAQYESNNVKTNDALDAVKSVLYGWINYSDESSAIYKLRMKQPYFHHAIQLQELFSKEYLNMDDIHQGNIMYKRGRIILTDPISTKHNSRPELRSIGVKVA